MISSKLNKNLWLCYLALILTATFLAGTGVVPGFKSWYSTNIAYREQTEALLKGAFALHQTPNFLRLDLAWHDGGVEQVWGLGVPFWRLPFEVGAKLSGLSAFPDRLAFGAAFMVLTLLIFRALPIVEENAKGNWAISQNPFRLTAIGVLIFFPPFVSLCRFRFDVYEEAVAYEYLYCVGLYAGLSLFARTPTKQKYLLISTLAGLSPFLRPTAGAYGVATMLLLWWCARKAKFTPSESAFGWILFCIGGGLLFITNQIRFGSGFEFGHSLNLNGFPVWFYDRIYNPFQKEPLLSAARDLFGAFFCVNTLNGLQTDLKNVYWGQSITPRWRNFYITCYDLSFLALLLGSWGVWLGNLRLRTVKTLELPMECRIAILWSMISIGSLFVFYLRVPVISNRYVFDTSSGFAVAIASFLFGLEYLIKQFAFLRQFSSSLVVGGMIIWLGWEIYFGKANAEPALAVDKVTMLEILHRHRRQPIPLPSSYEPSSAWSEYGIPFNGASWARDGRMPSMATLFVSSPEYLQIQVAPTNVTTKVDYSKIQAKIGLEWLAVESIKDSGTNCVVRFKGPKRAVYQKGIQVVFLAYVDPANIASPQSPLKLLKVQWRDGE